LCSYWQLKKCETLWYRKMRSQLTKFQSVDIASHIFGSNSDVTSEFFLFHVGEMELRTWRFLRCGGMCNQRYYANHVLLTLGTSLIGILTCIPIETLSTTMLVIGTFGVSFLCINGLHLLCELYSITYTVITSPECYWIKKLRGFSPPANYTDRATAACRRS
jgi:hypothetical protein